MSFYFIILSHTPPCLCVCVCVCVCMCGGALCVRQSCKDAAHGRQRIEGEGVTDSCCFPSPTLPRRQAQELVGCVMMALCCSASLGSLSLSLSLSFSLSLFLSLSLSLSAKSVYPVLTT